MAHRRIDPPLAAEHPRHALEVSAGAELGAALPRFRLPARAEEHAADPRRAGADHAGARHGAGAGAQLAAAPRHGDLPLRLLRARRGRRGGLFRRLPADLQWPIRRDERLALRLRPADARLAEPALAGDGDRHHRRHLAMDRLQRHHHPRRAAEHPAGTLRGRGGGRRAALAAAPPDHAAAAEAGAALRAGAVDHRHDAAFRRALPDHPYRPRQRHRDARHLPLPARLHAHSISAMPRPSPIRSR